MTIAPVTLRRYYLPSEKYEGWALIVIGSDGFFSAVDHVFMKRVFYVTRNIFGPKHAQKVRFVVGK